jgi:quinol monooxygenase YgiN
MYGTVARMQLKPGMEARLMELDRQEQAVDIPEYVASYVYRMDNEPNIYYLAVAFESKDAYVANANSPEQDARYREMRELFESDPEWHDGEIVSANPTR